MKQSGGGGVFKNTFYEAHVMSQVTHLGNDIYIGPTPSKKDDVLYLRNKLEISCIVDLTPIKLDQKWSYRDHLPAEDKYTKFIHVEFNMDTLSSVNGKTVVEKNQKEASRYVEFCEKIKSQIESFGAKKIFIHNQTGFKEEAIVGFTLLKLMYPDDAPENPCQWLTDKQYNMILSDSGETRELMLRIYKEIDRLKNGLSKFFKKIKK